MLICRIMEQLHPMGMNHLFRRAASFYFCELGCLYWYTNKLVSAKEVMKWVGGHLFCSVSSLKRLEEDLHKVSDLILKSERRWKKKSYNSIDGVYFHQALLDFFISLFFHWVVSSSISFFFSFFLREIGQNMTRSIPACASDDGKVESKWIKR